MTSDALDGSVSEAAVPGQRVLDLLDKAIAVQSPLVRKNIARARQRNPEATPEEVIRNLERMYVSALTGTGAAVGGVVVASLAWAAYQTMTSPIVAFLSTFTRLWELGVGALLAVAAGSLARLPDLLRPILSWLGPALIGAAFVLIDGTSGFPAPWALLPVAGAALVIGAGIGREPDLQGFLRNPVSTYLGDLLYSLYLVHWPVIVLLATVMDRDAYYYASAVTLTLGLAVALHHFVENPMRYADRGALRQAREDRRHGLHHTSPATKLAGVGALILITLSVISYAMSPEAIDAPAPVAPAVPAP